MHKTHRACGRKTNKDIKHERVFKTVNNLTNLWDQIIHQVVAIETLFICPN